MQQLTKQAQRAEPYFTPLEKTKLETLQEQTETTRQKLATLILQKQHLQQIQDTKLQEINPLEYTLETPKPPWIPKTPYTDKEEEKEKTKKPWDKPKIKRNLKKYQDPWYRFTGKAKYSTVLNQALRKKYGNILRS